LDLHKLELDAVAAVKQAANIFNCGTGAVKEKDGAANLVTDADIEIQHFLKKELHKIFPQAGFLCEEENEFDTDSEYRWSIDPIDGTTNFVRGIPECAISVGLLHKNQSLIGIVYAPRLNLLFTATKGNGAFCNGERIRVSTKAFEQSLFCTALSLYKKNLADICSSIVSEVYSGCSDIRRLGSCALELCYLAMGRCDLYFEIRVFPWDFAAAYLILTEAGGILRGYNNKELSFDNVTMLIGANNQENFEKLNKIVLNNIPEPLMLGE